MRYLRILWICLFLILTASTQTFARKHSLIDTAWNAAQLDSIFVQPVDSIIVILVPGDYRLRPKADIDTAVDKRDGIPVSVQITYGLKITAKYVKILGAQAYGSAIYTNAGYGLYFLNCANAYIEGVIITGGARDPDSLATDAGIVVKNSKVKIVDNLIFENMGDSSIVRKTRQGIMGICGREGSYCFIFNNQIARNSWNGIGIYKNASATITGNLVDGVDKPKEGEFGGGRGIGIFLTRNAKATIETNVVKRYTSGIGVFINADALISENLVEDIDAWGMCVYADTGKPKAHIENNVIYKTGACGASIIRQKEGSDDPGYFRNNIIVETAQNRHYDSPSKYCYQCALSVLARPDHFAIADNVFYKNFWLAPCFTSLDLMEPDFAQILQTRFSTLPLRWYAGYSEFVQRFYFFAGKPGK
jgi:putative cofactor-binding repeat protein